MNEWRKGYCRLAYLNVLQIAVAFSEELQSRSQKCVSSWVRLGWISSTWYFRRCQRYHHRIWRSFIRLSTFVLMSSIGFDILKVQRMKAKQINMGEAGVWYRVFLWYLICRIHLRSFFFPFVSLDINGSTDGWGLEHLKSLGAIDWLVGSFMGKLCRTWRFQMWSFLVASTTFDMKMSKHSLRQPYWPHLSMVSWDDFTLHSTLVEVEKSPFQMIL